MKAAMGMISRSSSCRNGRRGGDLDLEQHVRKVDAALASDGTHHISTVAGRPRLNEEPEQSREHVDLPDSVVRHVCPAKDR